jgi:hypothetical protein
MMDKKDPRWVIDGCAFEYKKISEAPTERDLNYDDEKIAAESGKLYKSVDAAGNIYLMVNPIYLRHHRDEHGRVYTKRPAPKLLYTHADAVAACSGKKKITGAGLDF